MSAGASPIAASSSEPSEPKPPSAATMRKWMGLGVAFVSTLAFAAVLVTLQIRTRQDELRLQYALSAARLGRAIELKYESSREVVNNVTSVLRVAESETKSALLDASQARAKQELNAEVERAAAALKQKLEQEQAALTQATAQEKAAWKGAFDALDDCLAKVASSTTAQQEVVKASLAADSAEGQLDLGLTALGSAQAVPEGVSVLQQELTTAKAEMAAKKATADAADELAKKTCEKAGDAKAALAASENKAAAEKRVEVAAKLAESAKQASDQKRETPSETFQNSVAHLRSPAYLFALGMKQHLPPSYAPHIDACTDKPGDAELCVARVIAKINGSPGTLFPCPQDGDAPIEGPTLTDGGLAVAIPSTDQHHHHAICAKVPIDELFSILPSAATGLEEPQRDRDGDFDAQVLLSSSGQVLRGLESADTHLRIVRFPQFKPEQGQVSSMAESVQIGPDLYRVFFQPVRVTMATALGRGDPKASGKTESNDIVVAGLVRESRLNTAATQISLGSYLWFVLLLAFGLLCLPLAKLWFLSTRSSFGRFAVTLLGASAVLITLLTIVLTLGLVAHNRLAKRLDLQLADVAFRLGDKLRTRSRDSSARLQAFTQAPQAACGRQEITQGMFSGDDQPSKVCERASRQDFAPGTRLFFADEQGRQTIKYARAENVTAPIKVGFRDYFQRAMRDQPVCVGQVCTFKTFPEVVRSATSGKFVLVVATKLSPPAAPANATQPSVEQRSRMAALETELALTELVLPSAFQAAIVQDDGRVMLHSDSNARFGQQLFADLDRSEALRAAMTAEQAGSFNVRYLGIPSRLAVQPLGIEGSKWFAVAVAPRSIIDATAVNIGLTTLVAFGCLLLLIVALAFVSLVATQTLPWIVGRKVPGDTGRRRRRILSLRPHARYAANYASVGLFATRAAIVLGVGSLLSCGYSSLWLIASVLTTALVLVWLPGIGLNGPFETTHRLLSAWLGRARDKISWKRGHDVTKMPTPPRARLGVSYPLALTGLVGVAISAPATALFASSYDYYAETLVRAEHHHLVEALRNQPQCLRPPSEGSDCANVIQTGNFRPSQATVPDAKDRVLDVVLNPVPWLADKLPLLGSRVPALLTRADLGAASVFSFVRTPPDLVHKNAKGEAIFATPVPALLSRDYGGGPLLWTAFGFATFLGLGWVAVSCTLRRLFLLKTLAEQRETHCDEQLSRTLLDMKLWESRRCTLVLHPSPRLKAALLAPPGTIDFTTANEQQLSQQKPGHLWLVSNLEALLHDKDLAARIERYAPHAHRFVILSAVDPLRRAQPELLDAWTRALSTFREVEGLQPKQKHRPPTTIAMAGWWRDCDADERRILSQLAVDGYTNPHPANIPAIKHLVGRGLLSSNRLTIASPAFANYVRHATTAADIQSWEDAAEGSLWQAIKVPLGTGVAALLTALAASKPELGVASALVPLATVSLPAILKVLAAMVNKT